MENPFLMGRYEQEILRQIAFMQIREEQEQILLGMNYKTKDSFESKEVN